MLPRQRLMAILSAYGEYPAQYRHIIWKSLLQLPNDTLSYCTLLEKGQHSCAKATIHVGDRVLRKNLKQIISLLAHWSKILGKSFNGEHHFLPHFVLPFLRIASNNMLMCFEMIATILINQCNLWFEFSPMLPLNYLGLIENLIDHFEPSLLIFYQRHSIDSSIYAWPLMRTAFSEILAEFQWNMLWDYIVTEPSYFLVFVIVAFNCVQHVAIERLKNANEIRAFFTEPNAVDMKLWLRKAYELMELCPNVFHPNQYMDAFVCLGIDNQQYRKILNYPYDEWTKQAHQKRRLKRERASINQRYLELEKFEMDLQQKIVNSIQADEQRKRMQNVALMHEQAMIDAVKRTEIQRQHLILSERQLNSRDALMKMIQMENKRRHTINERNINWQNILCDFNKMVRKKSIGNLCFKEVFILGIINKYLSFYFENRNYMMKRSCWRPNVHFVNVTLLCYSRNAIFYRKSIPFENLDLFCREMRTDRPSV